MSKRAVSLISKYFAEGDVDDLCRNDDDEVIYGNSSCKDMLSRETVNALGKIKNLLVQMKAAKTPAQYTSLQALMGKEVVKNQFVLNTLFALDTDCKLTYQVKVEGQRISRLIKTVPANPACR